MPRERVLSFGVAQFEVYKDPSRIDRTEFLELNGLPSDRKVVMYAGSSKGTNEIHHLTILDDAIENGDLPPISILYRPHPWGGGGKGGERLLEQKWRNVFLEASMLDYLRRVQLGGSGKFLSDCRDTHDVLSHIDALMSPLSTIILEAALHRKPVLCFMPDSDGSDHFRLDAALLHFHEMFEIPEILVANGYNELILRTKDLISSIGDERRADALVEKCQFFVQPNDRSYGERLTTFMHELLHQPYSDQGVSR